MRLPVRVRGILMVSFPAAVPMCLLVCVLAARSAIAQVENEGARQGTNVRAVSAAEYRNHLASLKRLVEACAKTPDECDSKKTGEDERVEGAAFETRWTWLREELSNAHSAAQPERDRGLREAAARLDEDEADAVLADTNRAEPAQTFTRARRRANEVLARPEFRTVAEQSYWEREIARFWQWVGDLFGGVARFGRRSPWLVPVMEWSSITLASAGVLTWMFRMMQRQRLAVRIESNASAEVWQREADNWAEMARAEAAREDWRAAVHCLYWAAIVMMEGRKLWRQNRARTPREYLALLEPGSRGEHALARLTRLFERIWYGLRPAGAGDYASAMALFDELRSA